MPDEVTERCRGPKGQSPSTAQPMTQAEFLRFSDLIIGQCGIKMPTSISRAKKDAVNWCTCWTR
jgi:hypothetical protein